MVTSEYNLRGDPIHAIAIDVREFGQESRHLLLLKATKAEHSAFGQQV